MRRNDNRGLFRHIEELQERIDSLCVEQSQLKECRRALEDETQALKAENAELKVEIRRLVDDNTRLKRTLNELTAAKLTSRVCYGAERGAVCA